MYLMSIMRIKGQAYEDNINLMYVSLPGLRIIYLFLVEEKKEKI